MNGLPLQQMPIAEITNVNPLKWIDEKYKRNLQQLQTEYEQQQMVINQSPENAIQILNREYEIEYRALDNRFRRLPDSEEKRRQAADAVEKLNATFARKATRLRGKVVPELRALDIQMQQAQQQLKWQRAEKELKIKHIQELLDKGIVTDRAGALAEQYQLADYNIPASYFRQPDPTQEIIRINMAIMEANKKGDNRTVAALENRRATLMRKISPDVAEAAEKSTRLSGLETRKKRQRTAEEPGTLAEEIREIKNKSAKTTMPFGGFGTMGVVPTIGKRKPTAGELRKRGTQEAYEEGKRLGYWN